MLQALTSEAWAAFKGLFPVKDCSDNRPVSGQELACTMAFETTDRGKRKADDSFGLSAGASKLFKSSFSSLPSDPFATDECATNASSPNSCIIEIAQPMHELAECTVYPPPVKPDPDHEPSLSTEPVLAASIVEVLSESQEHSVIVLSSDDDDDDSYKSGTTVAAIGQLSAPKFEALASQPKPLGAAPASDMNAVADIEAAGLPESDSHEQAEPQSLAEPGPSGSSLHGTEYVVDQEARLRGFQALEKYREHVRQLQELKERKADMQAFGALKGKLTPSDQHGHIPGWNVGDKFNGKGELCITGIHQNYCGGIYYRKDQAWAVVLSGGYVDDDDTGLEFVYTGMGGQGKTGRQERDQTWTKGNLALQNACIKNLPIRVARCLGKGSTEYVYEGLYRIDKCYMEPGEDKFLVCKFKMVGIPGHSKASHKVENRRMNLARFQNRDLAARVKAPRQKQKSGKAASKGRSASARKQGKPGKKCIIEDLAGGLEAVKIPVYNDVDDTQLPGGLTYIKHNAIVAPANLVIGHAMEHRGHVGGLCGIHKMGECKYNEAGLLMSTEFWGIWECGSSCSRAACRLNRVASGGIQLPLEVFYTGAERGWGVRCARTIVPGQFICEYVGEVLVEQEADRRKGDDEYLFELSHFLKVQEDVLSSDHSEEEKAYELEQLPGIPPNSVHVDEDGDKHLEHLSLDAKWKGNIARFINHSCKGNCDTQTVLLPGDSSLYYRLCIFAVEEIPAYTELTYDYKYVVGSVPGRVMHCGCGEKTCRKRLL